MSKFVQLKPSKGDIADCGWIQDQFQNSFGCGGRLDLEPGMDGHLWIMIPISETEASTATLGAGIKKPLIEIFANPNPNDWKLHGLFYKFSRGFFRPKAWIACIKLMNSRNEYTLGFIGSMKLRQFSLDLSRMLETGYPTFKNVDELLETIP